MKATVARSIGKKPRMASFLHILWGVTALAHVPFFVAVLRACERAGLDGGGWIALAATAAGIGLFLGRARAGMPDRKRHAAIVRFLDVPYYVHWCACIFALLLVVVSAPLMLVADLVFRGRPLGHGDLYLGSYLAGLVVCGYGILVRRRWFSVDEVDLPVAGLPASFDGYRIAQLSDLHIGALTPRSWGERWVRSSNRRAPDLAVVTGDMVTSGTDFHGDIAGVLGGLRARDGVIVAMGNHDYFGEGEPLVSLLRGQGVTVLRNESTTVKRGDDTLFVAAIDDTWTRRADMERALAQRDEGVVTLLLAHDPETFTEAAGHGVDVVLSGHTHGGQIALPFFARFANLSSLTHRFTLGVYRLGRSTLYVHPGLGTTGPPIRIGVAPAVVVLRLRAA